MYTAAFEKIVARPDFDQIKGEVLGEYEQSIGPAAVVANDLAISITPEAKQYVLDWLKEDYSVEMK